jgi:hypothetical protein
MGGCGLDLSGSRYDKLKDVVLVNKVMQVLGNILIGRGNIRFSRHTMLHERRVYHEQNFCSIFIFSFTVNTG